MKNDLILASGSQIRAKLLRDAGLKVQTESPKVDEDAIKASLLAEGTPPRDIADGLAEAKTLKISGKFPEALVLGADQVLELDRQLLSKPESKEAALDQLKMLRGQTHRLFSAAVLYENGAPIWRFIGTARLTMRAFSDTYLHEYVDRNWPEIAQSVGGYMLEKEGVRLFSTIHGDHFTILGLPLLELLNYLAISGRIDA